MLFPIDGRLSQKYAQCAQKTFWSLPLCSFLLFQASFSGRHLSWWISNPEDKMLINRETVCVSVWRTHLTKVLLHVKTKRWRYPTTCLCTLLLQVKEIKVFLIQIELNVLQLVCHIMSLLCCKVIVFFNICRLILFNKHKCTDVGLVHLLLGYSWLNFTQVCFSATAHVQQITS